MRISPTARRFWQTYTAAVAIAIGTTIVSCSGCGGSTDSESQDIQESPSDIPSTPGIPNLYPPSPPPGFVDPTFPPIYSPPRGDYIPEPIQGEKPIHPTPCTNNPTWCA